MILIINPENGQIDYFPSLKSACKFRKWMKYNTLKNKILSIKPILYKKMWIYRINHSEL